LYDIILRHRDTGGYLEKPAAIRKRDFRSQYNEEIFDQSHSVGRRRGKKTGSVQKFLLVFAHWGLSVGLVGDGYVSRHFLAKTLDHYALTEADTVRSSGLQRNPDAAIYKCKARRSPKIKVAVPCDRATNNI